ncbi:MAG TPA: hypothetical protein VFQ77_04280 [Pseudonocardiaceae bacterium]|nr:hypothetical protein [Pseudonocardiaceae bacterium]
MTQLNWYGADPLMGPADRLPLVARQSSSQIAPAPHVARLLGVRLARPPTKIHNASAQGGRHSKSYTVDRKTENTKVIVDGNEENHDDVTETEREVD